MLVWVKNNHVLGRCDYHYKHEPVFFGWKEGGTHNFYGGSSCFSVLEFDKPMKNDLHPTMKPVELIGHLISNSSAEDDVVLDIFLGSGSTLIACEKTGRRCFGMEISPHYCDCIIKRWQEYSGQKAVRESDKRRWDEIKPTRED
jgi:DNA modification methylase